LGQAIVILEQRFGTFGSLNHSSTFHGPKNFGLHAGHSVAAGMEPEVFEAKRALAS